MKRLTHLFSFIVILLLLVSLTNTAHTAATVAEGISIDAEFRPRFELDGKDFNSDTGYDSYGTLRTRLGIKADGIIENSIFYFQIADSRQMGYTNPYLTGTSPGPNGFDNNLGVSRVYLEVRDIAHKGMMFKIGRFDNNHGRAYIFGAGNWNPNGPRTYDGVKFGMETEHYSYHLWSFYGVGGDRHWIPEDHNPAKVPNAMVDYKTDNTLTGVDYTFLDSQINLLAFLDLDQRPVEEIATGKVNVAQSRWTVAANLKRDCTVIQPAKLDFDAAYQFGSMGYDTGKATIAAWMLAGDFIYNVSKNHDFWLGAGFHFTSAINPDEPTKVNWFNDRYASLHKIHGSMDLFKDPEGIKSHGMRDFIIRSSFQPMENLTCKLDFHHFAVGESFVSRADASDANVLGQELDVSVDWEMRKGLSAQLGADIFQPSEDWKGRGANIGTFAYLMLLAKI